MFASHYFQKNPRFTPRIPAQPASALSMIVVIPCYQEPDLLQTLDSLVRCTPPEGEAEVIILVNEPEGSPPEVTESNMAAITSVMEWKKRDSGSSLVFHLVGPVIFPRKWAGVGLARKAGMDEALWRFHLINNPAGIIVSLDADTLVEPNYLTEIETHFRKNPSDIGATIRFRHQEKGFSGKQLRGIRLYEQYMAYYKHALTWSGYPHSLYTVGSAFAVTAEAYMKRGGMTRRKAGEDFYFLQTLTQLGNVGEIDSTTIYPSPRISRRVPFGTGPVMKKWMDGSEELMSAFNIEAFRDLKALFTMRKRFFRATPLKSEELISELPQPVAAFMQLEGVTEALAELSANCSTSEVFSHRFFQVFTAFKILRFLNYSHPLHYLKIPLEECCHELKQLFLPFGADPLSC